MLSDLSGLAKLSGGVAVIKAQPKLSRKWFCCFCRRLMHAQTSNPKWVLICFDSTWQVGGASEVEVGEVKDRLDDALCATRLVPQGTWGAPHHRFGMVSATSWMIIRDLPMCLEVVSKHGDHFGTGEWGLSQTEARLCPRASCLVAAPHYSTACISGRVGRGWDKRRFYIVCGSTCTANTADFGVGSMLYDAIHGFFWGCTAHWIWAF